MTDLVVVCTKQLMPDTGAIKAGLVSGLSRHLDRYCSIIRIYLVFVLGAGTELQNPLEFPK